jgi:putative ABC transport system substrate-binding protein
MVKRREFVGLIAGAALCPLVAKAQERTRTIGVLTGNVEVDLDAQARVRAFKESFYARWEAEDGETDNLHFEVRWPGPDASLQQRHAEELASLSPDLILATSTATTLALRKATSTIPIVFVGLSDPVATGIVSDLARPEANVTGFMLYEHRMAGKWLSLLKEMMPSLKRVGLFFNPDTAPYASLYLRTAWELGEQLRVAVAAISVRRPGEIEPEMARFATSGRAGLIILPDGGFIASNRAAVIGSAARYKLPAIYGARFYVVNGGLLSYGADLTGQFRDSAEYAYRILRGATPADLPIQFSTRFDLVINAATAESLNLVIPQNLLLDAEVIEEAR